MANRKGVFIGAYVPNELKESLRRRAAAEHRTLSQEITRILTEAIHGRNLPAEALIDARLIHPPVAGQRSFSAQTSRRFALRAR
jgi:plasmid stability protein